MAFSLSLPTRKFWLFAAGVLVVVLALLWWTGKKYQEQAAVSPAAPLNLSATDLAYYQKIAARATELRALTSESLTKTATATLATLATQATTKDTYEQTDLKFSKKEDTASLKLYGQSLGQILQVFSTPRPNEAQIMLTALDTKDESQLAALASVKTELDSTVAKLLKLPTPKSAANLQLALINNLHQQSRLLSNMLQVFNQPLLALESAQAEYQTVADFYQLAGQINAYFHSRGVTFSGSEAVKIYQTI
jgi:hypothetical protein